MCCSCLVSVCRLMAFLFLDIYANRQGGQCPPCELAREEAVVALCRPVVVEQEYNARFQPLPEAAAQCRLLAVGCKPL
jgi:hypothetical protein